MIKKIFHFLLISALAAFSFILLIVLYAFKQEAPKQSRF